MLRIFKMFLSKFQVYNAILLTIATMLYITAQEFMQKYHKYEFQSRIIATKSVWNTWVTALICVCVQFPLCLQESGGSCFLALGGSFNCHALLLSSPVKDYSALLPLLSLLSLSIWSLGQSLACGLQESHPLQFPWLPAKAAQCHIHPGPHILLPHFLILPFRWCSLAHP